MKQDLLKKYEWTGEKYTELISNVIKLNQFRISQIILDRDKKTFETEISRLEPKRGTSKEIKIPNVFDILKKSPTIIKAASRGELISKTLREKLKNDVKQTLLEKNIMTTHGTMRKDIVTRVKLKMTETYSGYIRKGRTRELPKNLHNIAVTETNSVINSVRHEYVKEIKATTGRQVGKEWVHVHTRGKEDRKGHVLVSLDDPIAFNEPFKLKEFKRTKAGSVETGKIFYCDRPHDPKLPASETITCGCYVRYKFI